jgi:hypothetical protein
MTGTCLISHDPNKRYIRYIHLFNISRDPIPFSSSMIGASNFVLTMEKLLTTAMVGHDVPICPVPVDTARQRGAHFS